MTRRSPRRVGPAPTIGRRLPFDLGPAASAVGLVVVAALTFVALGGSLPSISGPGGGGGGGNGGPVRTATPSNVVIVDPRADIPGSVLYVKDGNIWTQSGATARQLTNDGHDSMPAWAPDGQSIYFVRSTSESGRWPSGGSLHTYNLKVPRLMRIAADGSGEPEELLVGRIKKSGNTWSYFIREPAISPDEQTIALITDGPDPTRSDIVLKLLDIASGDLTDPKLAQSQSLGHSDPVWAPDGRSILYVRNAREGARGTPAIYRLNLESGKASAFTGPGYTTPAFSRDGRYVAATKTSNFGTDIVVLDARSGAELLRLTNDESSFSPTWSPLGDAIAFFRVQHGVVDLVLLPLEGAAPGWTVGEPLALTINAGLEADSSAAWFIPEDQLPPLPTPTPVVTAAPSGPATSAP